MRVMSSKLGVSLVLIIAVMLYRFLYDLIIILIRACLLVIFVAIFLLRLIQHFIVSCTFIEVFNFRVFLSRLSTVFVIASVNTFGSTSINFARLTQV